jgi:hypothetical protein
MYINPGKPGKTSSHVVNPEISLMHLFEETEELEIFNTVSV